MLGNRKVWVVLAASAVLAALSIWPTTAGAQNAAKEVVLPGVMNNPVLLAGIGIGIQFVPGVRKWIGNALIPYVTTILAWVAAIVAPQAAHAAGGPVAAMVVASFPTFGLGGFLAGIGGAVLQSAQGYLLQRMFAWPGRHLPQLPTDSRA